MQNIDDLKAGFDLVKIKHFNSEHYKGTHVALVKDGKVFVGVAKCHVKDQFNRKLGLKISLGRAIFAWKIDAGIEKDRRGLMVYGQRTFTSTSPEGTEKILKQEVFTEPTPTLEPVSQMIGAPNGCCGDCH